MIIHYLDRKSSSRKYDDADVTCQNSTTGVFTVTGSSKLHTVNFRISSAGQPSCTCLDWIQWRIPCKHFFAVFKFYHEWGWEKLPAEFTTQPHISCVATATSQQHLGTQHSPDVCIDHEIVPNVLAELPTKQVCVSMTSSILQFFSIALVTPKHSKSTTECQNFTKGIRKSLFFVWIKVIIFNSCIVNYKH